MQTFSDRIELEFNKLIDREIEEVKEVMAHGSLMSWDQYKYMSGKVAGFNRTLEILDEARKIVQGIEN